MYGKACLFGLLKCSQTKKIVPATAFTLSAELKALFEIKGWFEGQPFKFRIFVRDRDQICCIETVIETIIPISHQTAHIMMTNLSVSVSTFKMSEQNYVFASIINPVGNNDM